MEINNVHIYMASEIWLVISEEFFTKNYTIHDQRRGDGYAGAAILFKNNITFKPIELPEFSVINAVAAETTNLPLNITFVSVYVPAKKKEVPEAAVRKDLLTLLGIVKTFRYCVLGGDFNAFNNVWGSAYNDVRGLLLAEELESFCMLNDGSPTRVPTGPSKPNPLDLTWSSSNLFERIDWSVKMESLGSDHLVVSMEIDLAMNSEEITVKAKIDYQAFYDNVNELDLENIDDLSSFILAIEGAKGKAMLRPKTTRNPKFIPKSYWNEEINRLQKLKKAALVKYFRNRTINNLIEYKRLRAVFKRKLKLERTKAWRVWAESLSPTTPVKDIFRKFKMLNNFRVPNRSNAMFHDPDMVDRFLANLCKSDHPSGISMIETSDTELPFSMAELDFVLSLKKDSAPGIDGIKYGDLLKFPEKVREKFLVLLNKVWSSQDIPAGLKRILMVLIPKPGRDPQLLTSHRPIALLSVYLKTINSMIKVRLENLVKERSLIDNQSYGFVKHRSSIDCVNHLLSLINEKLENGKKVMAIFMDLEDAFSNVNLAKLQRIMSRLGIPRQYSNWIVSCYQEREITIDTIGGNSTKSSNEGVPQGDVLRGRS